MNVSLTPELEKFVSRRVKSGMYTSASEVVREGLRLLEQQTTERQAKFEALKKEIMIGVKDAEEGRVRAFDTKALEDIKRRGRERLAAQHKGKAA